MRRDVTISRRKFLAGSAAAAGGLAVSGPTLWLPPARASAPPAAGVHLAFGADPQRTMAISWSTAPGVVTGVRVGQGGDFGELIAPTTAAAPGVDATRYHHAGVGGLAAGSEYRYRIETGTDGVFEGTFRTAADPGAPFRFATFGDMGVSAGAAQNLAIIRQANPAFCFVVGDLCYADLAGGASALAALPYNPAIWDQWLAQVQPSAAGVPWMSTVGNHEMERDGSELGYDGYLARFALPGNGAPGGPVTYSFRYGNVGFVALDGNDASYEIDKNWGYLEGAQETWLRTTLGQLRADPAIDFVVAGFHNCMYCTNAFHGSDGGNRQRWEPIFDEHGVDLVVNGHNHCYERTHPIRAGVHDETTDSSKGTTYLTAGGAGQAEYPTSSHPVSYVVAERVEGVYGGVRVPETALWSAARYMAHSVAVVDVTPRDPSGQATMTITGLSKAGQTVDAATLRRVTATS